ncbi:hypothetical protein [Paenibacillus sp. Leaf72]|uniref:hypothetical protein n=1 Tax=Paenibacillus sp. Leaf72 TaxID=1736234 RepID=UPI0006F4B21F|nr:hypothetical protein [Paenibacillus sp. Leaf72]KQN96925.1 hypothetical protein ASF12_22920 [Paenibacillus sp. Leaf72]
MRKLFQPKYLPISKGKMQQYNYETIWFLEKVAAHLFKSASGMAETLDQHTLVGFKEKVLHGTITDDEILKLNIILKRYGYMNWVFGRKSG